MVRRSRRARRKVGGLERGAAGARPGEAARVRHERNEGRRRLRDQRDEGIRHECGGRRVGHSAGEPGGPGGVRHARRPLDTQRLLAAILPIRASPPTARGGTRSGCARPSATLSGSPTPSFRSENSIGYPGQYLKEGWQTCFVPHYAATFVGRGGGGVRARARLRHGSEEDRRPVRPASHRVDVDQRRDGPLVACGTSPACGRPASESAKRNSRAAVPATSSSISPKTTVKRLHPRVRRAVAEPSERARAHLSRSVVLRAARQRRSHSGDDRQVVAGAEP